MLFLKRCSDVFEARREEIVAEQPGQGARGPRRRSGPTTPSYYADDAFYVPELARWAHLRDEVHHDVGAGLNTALAQLEEHNTSLEGVLAHIDFNRKVGQSKIPDKRLRDLIKHFSNGTACATRTSSSPTCSAPPTST